jgi:hypothetical protein
MNQKRKISLESIKFLAMALVVFTFLFISFAEAQVVTRKTRVSGYLYDQNGDKVSDGVHRIRFSIYSVNRFDRDVYPSNSDSSFRVWSEEREVEVFEGQFGVYLGDENPFPEDLSFGGNNYYLGIRVDDDSEVVPRRKIENIETFLNGEPTDEEAMIGISDDYLVLGPNGVVDVNNLPVGTNAGDIVILGPKGEVDSDFLPIGDSKGDLVVLGAGGEIDMDYLPTGTGDNDLIVGDDNRLHVSNKDTGTTSLDFNLGSSRSVGSNDFYLTVSDATNKPSIRYNGSLGAWQYSDNGVDFISFIPSVLNVSRGGTGTATQFTTGSIVFAGASGVYSEDNLNFFWDDVNNRLGLDTTSPTALLDVGAATTGNSSLRIRSGSAPTSPNQGDIYSSGASLYFYNGSSWDTLNSGGGVSTFLGLTDTLSSYSAGSILFTSGSAVTEDNSSLYWDNSSDYLGVGTNSPSATLDVVGNAEISNDLDVDSNTLFVDASTNRVGIGTSSPGYELDIVGGDMRMINDHQGIAYFLMRNANSSSTSQVLASLSNDVSIYQGITIATNAVGFTTSGAKVADGSYILSESGLSGGLSIGTVASSPLRFYTGGSADSNERVRIDESGNVGIGTASPSSKLDIVSGLYEWQIENNLSFSYNSENRLSIFDNGGITNLGSRASRMILYDLNGNDAYNLVVGRHSVNTTQYTDVVRAPNRNELGSYVGVGHNLKLAAGDAYASDATDYDGGDLYLTGGQAVNSGSNGDVLLQTVNGGNVGIGTTSPTRTLDVESADLVAVDITGSNTGNDTYLDIENTNIGVSSRWGIFDGVLGISSGGDQVADLSIDSSGNVGIGDDTPSDKLHVSGGGVTVTDGVLTLDATGSFGRDMVFTENGVNGIINQSGGGFLHLQSNGETMITLQPSASNVVGIMNDTPNTAYALDVIGDIYTSTNVYAAGSIGVGTNSPSYKLSVGSTDASNQIGLYHDNSNAYFTTDDGFFIFETDEGTNTNSELRVRGKGTGFGMLRAYDQDNSENLMIYAASGSGNISVTGTSPTSLYMQYNADANLDFFGGAAEGETPSFDISGYRTGSGSRKTFSLGVESDVNDTLSLTGLGNYYFDGNVGIGTNSPGYKLEVSGESMALDGVAPTFSINASNSFGRDFSITNGGAELSMHHSGGPIVLGDGVNTLYLTNTNRVGVGSGVSNTMGSTFAVSGNATVGSGYYTSTAPSNGLLVEGDLGIGVASPTSKIHGDDTLNAATGNEIAYELDYTVNKATSGNDTGLLINKIDTNSPGTSNIIELQVGGSPQFFVRDNGTTFANYIDTQSIKSNANNTTLAVQSGRTFSVADNSIETNGTFTNTTGSSAGFVIQPTYNQTSGDGANTDLLINRTETAVGSGVQLIIDAQVGGSSKFSIDNSGNVMIGSATPSAQLHTTGTVRFANFGAGTLTTDASGNVSVSSDIRLKNVEGEFTRGISDLVGIDPITYYWKKDSGLDTETLYSGFSAQNILEFIPEAVGLDPHGFYTLGDRPILATVVNAIKEQNEIVSQSIVEIDGISLRIDDVSSDSDEFRGSVDDQLRLIGVELDEMNTLSEEQQARLSLFEGELDAQQMNILEIEAQLQEINSLKNSQEELIDFMLAMDTDSFVKKDESGNVFLNGDLEVETVKGGEFVFSVDDPDAAKIGSGKICPVAPEDEDEDGLDDCSGNEIPDNSEYVDEDSDWIDDESEESIVNNGKWVKIETTAVDKNSKVYVTPVNSTGGQVLYVADIEPKKSFKVMVDEIVDKVIEFNWFIFEVEE